MTEPSYRGAPPGSSTMTALGELVAIYDRRAAQTHVVAPPMPEILAVLGPDICDVAALTRRLAASFDLADDKEAAIIVAERLTELAELGLVEAL